MAVKYSEDEYEPLSDDQIRELMRKSFELIPPESISERRKRYEYNSKWIKPEVIKTLSDNELQKKFLEYYKGGEGRQTLNQIHRDKIVRDIKRFREMLLYLLDETIPIKERFKNVVDKDGKYHIEGVGRGLASAFLMDYNLDKYCLWNGKTEMGFRVLGWNVYNSKDDTGTKYEKVLNALKKLRDDIGSELKISFLEVDFFLHFISAEEEGIKLVKEITKRDVTVDVPTPNELFIQKILEKNFDEVIGKKYNLELYQDDPDSSGAQYPTPVGRLDFLAKDKKTGDFVVIELKAGKATDTALGQILRYMGWVKENLSPPNKNVRGYIIAEDMDEKLKYALKMVNNVKFLKYKIFIKI